MKRALLILLALVISGCNEGGEERPDIPKEGLETPGEGGECSGDPQASAEAVAACEALNDVRLRVGLDTVDLNPALDEAADRHARFVLDHCDQYGSSGLSPHNESSAFGSDFSGADPMQRAMNAGYQGYAVGEVIAFVDDPEGSVQTWLNSLYHRLLILDPTAFEIGYGHGTVNKACRYRLYRHIDVMDIGLGHGGGVECFVYPEDGATDIPPEFNGMETPQPPPPPGGYPSGTIVTVQCLGKGWKWVSHKIVDNGGQELPHVAISNIPSPEAGVQKDPYALTSMTAYLALYTYEPLRPGSKYTVEVEVQRAGQTTHIKSSFTTSQSGY